MAEQSDLDKTEPATPRRREKAREEGQVVRSRELTTFCMLAAGVGAMWLLGAWFHTRLQAIVKAALAFEPASASDPQFMLAQAVHLAEEGLLTLLPVLGILAVAAVFSQVVLGGLVFSARALQFNLQRIDPLAGLARMFSANGLAELGKAVLKTALVAGVAVGIFWSDVGAVTRLVDASLHGGLDVGLGFVLRVTATVVLALLLLVIFDVPWQIFSFLRRLRMTREEVKQEMKEEDGDPAIKGRIRQLQRAASRRRMMKKVPQATVVVANPTHFAVALGYRADRAEAPRVLAKGQQLLAERIKEIARAHGVPILEAAPLARALYFHVDLDQEIPVDLYRAVARVLAWVYQSRDWHVGLPLPTPPDGEHLEIPPQFTLRTRARPPRARAAGATSVKVAEHG